MAVGDFVQGAIGGYQFVDDQFRKSEHDQQRRMAIQTDEERYRDERLRQQRRDIESANHAAFGRDQVRRQTAIADENLALNRENQQIAHRRAAIQDQQEAERHDWERQRHQISQQDQARAKLRDEAVFYAQRAMAGGSPFPKEVHDQLLEAGMPYLSFYDGIERPEVHQAAMSLAPVLQAVGSGNVEAINSPQALEAINTLYADEIQEGIGEENRARGGTIVDKRIVELAPSPVPGKFATIIEVTLDNGETYLAPRTRRASTDPEDPVKLLDAGVALDDLMGRYQLAQMREQGRQSIADQYRAIYGALPGEQSQPEYEFKTVTDINGSQRPGRFDPRSGRFEYLDTDDQQQAQDQPSIPRQAVQELLEDPSPQAISEFEEIFGAGSSAEFVGSAAQVASPGFKFNYENWPNQEAQEQNSPYLENADVEELSPQQQQELKEKVQEVSGARSIGRKVGEDIRFVVNEQGRIIAVSASVLSQPARQGLRLLSGAVSGVGEFIGGVFEGER